MFSWGGVLFFMVSYLMRVPKDGLVIDCPLLPLQCFLCGMKHSIFPLVIAIFRYLPHRLLQCSLLLSKGVHPKVVQEILGHSEVNVTMDIYSHVLPTMQRDTISRLDNLF
jgi:hypothetical protein